MSAESMLHKNVTEAAGTNHYHNNLIQCYFLLAQGCGWEEVMHKLATVADNTVEWTVVFAAGRRHLEAVRNLRKFDHLPN